jgi:hypothetical protein
MDERCLHRLAGIQDNNKVPGAGVKQKASSPDI